MTPIRDLVDADPAQPRQPVDALVGVGPDPGHDRPDGAPGDPHQLAHRGFRTRHRQPGHRVIEHRYARRGDAPTAPGTTVGPCSGQFTRGASASSTTCTVPQSNPRHRRRPWPRSNQDAAATPPTPPRNPFAAAHAPPPRCRRRRLPPRTPRTRCPQSRCAGRHPAAHAIASHCARRCWLLWFLTLDKPETLSDNDVRLLRSATHPRKCQKSLISVVSRNTRSPFSWPSRRAMRCSPF